MARVKGIQGSINTDTSEPVIVVTRLELHTPYTGRPNASQMNFPIIPFALGEKTAKVHPEIWSSEVRSTGGQSAVHFPSSFALPRSVVGGS